MRRSTQGMQFELGKIPYSEAKGSRVNRWTSPAAREMLENRRSMDTLESSTISDADSGVLLPLGGGEYVYGFYSARVYLGTPQQPVSLLMDSGSSDLAVNLVRLSSLAFSTSLTPSRGTCSAGAAICVCILFTTSCTSCCFFHQPGVVRVRCETRRRPGRLPWDREFFPQCGNLRSVHVHSNFQPRCVFDAARRAL